MTIKEAIVSCLSEPVTFKEGISISFGRCITLLIVVCVLTWDSAYVFYAMRFHLMPVLPEAGTLLSQVGFMTAFYGINKWAGSYQVANGPGLPATAEAANAAAAGK
jgi:hypothetical protein